MSAIPPSSCNRRCWPHRFPSFPEQTSAPSTSSQRTTTAAGGDWFDAIALGDRLVLIVGDVVGPRRRGRRGDVAIAHCAANADRRGPKRPPSHSRRSTASPRIRARLEIGHLVRRFPRLHDGRIPVLHSRTTRRPLLVSADANARYVEPSGAGPLGSRTGFPVRTETLDIGDCILLYSDGLIERPGRPLGASTAEFADLAPTSSMAQAALSSVHRRGASTRICSETLELLLRETGYSDDVTLLAAQRRTPPPPLHMTLDATIQAARAVRSRLREWLNEIGAHADDISDVVHAVSEFVENTVEHGYSTEVSDGVVIDASLTGDGNLHVLVKDRGTWKDHPRRRAGPAAAAWRWPKPWCPRRLSRVAATATTAGVTHQLTRPANFVTDTIVNRASVQRTISSEFDSVIRRPPRPHRGQRRRRLQHRVHPGSPDRRREPVGHSIFDDRSDGSHAPGVGRRQCPGGRPRPGATAGRRLCADCPARQPGAAHLVHGADTRCQC